MDLTDQGRAAGKPDRGLLPAGRPPPRRFGRNRSQPLSGTDAQRQLGDFSGIASDVPEHPGLGFLDETPDEPRLDLRFLG